MKGSPKFRRYRRLHNGMLVWCPRSHEIELSCIGPSFSCATTIGIAEWASRVAKSGTTNHVYIYIHILIYMLMHAFVHAGQPCVRQPVRRYRGWHGFADSMCILTPPIAWIILGVYSLVQTQRIHIYTYVYTHVRIYIYTHSQRPTCHTNDSQKLCT